MMPKWRFWGTFYLVLADFLVVDAIHTFIMDDQMRIVAVKNFLREGRFDPDGSH
jgi:hypothetical protein